MRISRWKVRACDWKEDSLGDLIMCSDHNWHRLRIFTLLMQQYVVQVCLYRMRTADSSLIPFFFILWVRQKHYFISSWCDRHSCSCIFFNLLHSDYVCLKPWHCKWWLQGKVHVSPGRQPNTELMLTLFHPGIKRARYKHTDWYQHLVGTNPRGFVMKK